MQTVEFRNADGTPWTSVDFTDEEFEFITVAAEDRGISIEELLQNILRDILTEAKDEAKTE